MNGHAIAATPTPPIAPDATYRKSRRVPASLVVAATGSTLMENGKERVRTLATNKRERGTDAVTRRPPPVVHCAGKIESRFSRVLRHDDAENALYCRDLHPRRPKNGGLGCGWRYMSPISRKMRAA